MIKAGRLTRPKLSVRFVIGGLIAICVANISAQVVPGDNVNMVAGRSWPDGDPFLQRQNEGVIAVSSRNVLHLVGGSNDYRTVDLPGLPADKPTGDAWLGLYKSFDGGKTWRSTLIPGYPQDNSPIGLASPLKGFDAAADPVVRAGSNGLFFYSGIAFQRAAIPVSAAASVSDSANGRRLRKAREEEREREEKRKEKARERAREKARERERESKKSGKAAKKTASAREQGARHQPDDRIRRGGEDDDEEAGGEAGTASSVFVSTLIDLNNRENGDPISYVRTAVVDHDSGGRFLDKQWMAVDVPRANAQLCVLDARQETGEIVRQSFPGGRVYVVYTALTDSGSGQKGQILFSFSTDCGATWSRPRDLSTVFDPDINDDGIVNNADLNLIKASFGKQCGDAGFNPAADTNGDCLVNVVDLTYVTRSVGRAFPAQARRVPQGASIAIDPLSGALYIAWREFKTATQPDVIQVVRSTDFGATFTAPRTIAAIHPFDQGTTETSFRTSAFPTITADGERVYVAWSARGFATQQNDPLNGDARIVMSTSTDGLAWTAPRVVDEPGRPGHPVVPALTFGSGKLSLLYYDLRDDVSGLFGPFVDELPILTARPPGLRHTLDPRIGQADPGAAPVFSSVRLASYSLGTLPGSEVVQQLQFNPPNLPIFRKGTAPFVGDYLDLVMSPTIRANADGTWAFNVEPSESAAGHAVWTDNRDVRAGPGGNLADYTPPNSASRQTVSLFDSTQAVPPCVADLTATRDQNIYTARFDNGLFAAALGNSKPLGAVQRAFALFVENATAQARSYRLSIPAQPPQGQATFDQFSLPQAPLTILDVTIPPRSTVARSVYVSSSVAQARTLVNVDEIAAPNAPGTVPGGRHGSIALNGDPTAPAIENPAIENPAIENRDINAVEVYTPVLSNAVPSPAIENSPIANPAIENPAIENVAAANPSVIVPAIENPAIENARIQAPAIENPAIENTDLVNGSISDTTWQLTNVGNTAAAYAVKLLLNSAIPDGFKTQLIIHKTYTTPAADGCDLKSQLHNVVLLNVITPQFSDPASVAHPAIENPAIENATVALAPGESANVTLRVFDPDKSDAIRFDPIAAVTPAVTALSVNSDDAQNGVTEPPVAIGITIVPSQAPDAVLTGGPYQQTFRANVPGTWSVTAGALPPGLTLNPATGQISGTPTTVGTFAFTITFTDTATPSHTVSQALVIRVGVPLAIATTALPEAIENVTNSILVDASGGIAPLTWALSQGAMPPGLSLNPSTGAISGTPTVPGSFAFTLTVHDSAVPQNSVSRPFTLTVAAAAFDAAWVGIDSDWSNAANWSPQGVPAAGSRVVVPGGLAHYPVLTQDIAVQDLRLAPGATINTNGHQITASGTVIAGNTIVGNGTLRMIGAGVSLSGAVPNLIIAGDVALDGALNVTGDLTVDGTLRIAGSRVAVTGRVISRTNALATILGGTRTLTAADVSGEWSGTILSTTGGPGTRFATTFTVQKVGTHLTATSPQLPGTVLSAEDIGITPGGALQVSATVTAATPGSCSPAQFTGVLTIDPTANVLSGTLNGINTDCIAESNTFTLRSGSTLTAGGVNTTGLTFDNVVVTFDNGAIEQFDNVTFSSYLPEVLQLRINHPGAALPLAFNGLRFDTTPTVGFYLFATDTAPDANVLTIDLTNAVAADGPAHTLVAGGAVVNWIGGGADLSVSQVRAPAVVFAGDAVLYTVTVGNAGPNAANNVTLADTVPPGSAFVSATPSQGSCAAPLGGVVSCSLGPMASGGSATIAVTVQSGAAGPIQNVAAVSSTTLDPVPANNSATDSTVVQVRVADVGLTKSHIPLQPVLGQNLTYALMVTNAGPNAATQLVVTDTLPASVSFVSASDPGCVHALGTVTCRLNALASGASATITILVTPTAAQPITNNASVATASSDPNLVNNTATDSSVVAAFGPCSQATFSGPASYSIGASAAGWLPVTADLNHDGRPDIVVNGGASANSVTVMLGNAAGGFDAPTSYDVGGSTRWPAVADFDGDGHPDIAVAVFGSNAIAILKGDGAGNFALAASAGTAGITTPFFLGAANLNGDAKPDLVAGSPAGAVVLLNQSTPGTFAFATTTYAQTSSGSSAVLADFDGDGDVDIALGKTNANTVPILLNDGSGAFPTSMQVPAAPPAFGANVSRVRDIGDLNGDGRIDLGVKLADGSFQVLLRNPAGGFDPPVQVTAPNAAFASFDTGFEASADFNGDGKLDLVREVFASNSQQMAMEVLLGDGTGTNFTPSVSLLTTLQDKFVISDFNGDGKPDLVAFRTDVPSVLVFLNTCGVAGSADLELQKIGPATVNNGTAFSYTVTVTNHGPDPATNVVVTDAMPFQGMTLTGGSSTQGACSVSGNALTCNVGVLANGASAVITVNVQPFMSGVMTNTAMARADEADPTPGNNSASASTTVNAGPVTFVVTNTNDSGAGSLRQGIANSNLNAGAGIINQITFNIPGTGPFTIAPSTSLPTVSARAIIDGTTQPGFSGTPIIELTGSNALLVGLAFTSVSSVRALAINRFPGNGIMIGAGGGGSTVLSNYIGTDVSGTIARPNGRGLNISSANNSIVGNLISGNTSQGILITGASATNNAVVTNRIGTNASVTAALGNGGDGVLIQSGASGNFIGGSNPGDGNVISGNQFGMSITSANGNQVVGNFIGTNANGTAALGNLTHGINVNTNASTNSVVNNIISGNVNGILLGSGANNNLISGNAIGANAARSSAIPNSGNGIYSDAGTVNTFTGNVVSGNANGITFVNGSNSNVLQGNRIGTNGAGTSAIANVNGGISITSSSNNIVGGTTAAVRNIVSGNGTGTTTAFGIGVFGTSNGNQIQGNYIGVDASGSSPLRNTGIGIQLGDASTGTIVGGTAAGAGNVVSGNGAAVANGSGIDMFHSTGNLVYGNLVGLSADGTAAIPNMCCGIDINAANNNTIGGTGAARNVISGNGGAGLVIANGSTGNAASGNLIGTRPDGVTPLANAGPGVSVVGTSANNTIGGTGAGAGNVIAYNNSAGVTVDSGTGNAIRGNAISSNALLGIDLGANGVTNNDPGDGDAGANNFQNFPLLARANPGSTVAGTLNSAANTAFAVDFFANAACDASGNGEGQRYLGSSNVNTNATGDASFSVVLSGASAVGEFVTATATDPNGNTSEFSPCVAVTNPGAQTFTVTSTADSGAGTLRQAILNSNLNSGFTNTIRFAVGSGSISIAPTSALPTISVPAVIDGTTQPGFAGTPIVELSGANAGAATGFNISAGGTTIRDLVINRFATAIALATAGANVIEGNYIGTNTAGTAALANGTGITIQASTNRIGGTQASQRNVISGNSSAAISIQSGANGNVVQGNYIGTDKNGAAALRNGGPGVAITSSSSNTIGGTAAGAGNVISGNDAGIQISQFGGPNATANLVQGNLIGPNVSGTTAIGNSVGGILFNGIAAGNTVGGSVAGAQNVISGNGGSAVALHTTAGAGNLVVGNLIGTNPAGTAAMANGAHGIDVTGPNNVVGGTASVERNVISGNTHYGVSITTAAATSNQVLGNFIGTNVGGTTAIPNPDGGVNVASSGTTIGGTAAGAGNLISGNTGGGISLSSTATGTIVQGNKIGTNSLGSAAIANTSSGIIVAGSNNTIGGASVASRNLISGNGSGIDIQNGAAGNVVESNFIGTNVDGSAALANTIGIVLKGSNNTIGAVGAGNVLSGNTINGINPFADNGTVVANNQIIGNIIGLNAAGTGAVPNGGPGIGHGVNGTGTFGFTRIEGNTISGNANDGLSAAWGGTFAIAGNFIGTNPNGSSAIPNARYGILLGGTANSTVGGTSNAQRNVISGNGASGIFLSNATNTTVQGNYIGVNAAGTAALGNADAGVFILNASNNTIGGAVAGASNIVAFNQQGVLIPAGVSNAVRGNAIYSNAGLGIDLGAVGVTPNDPGDGDGGANNLQNFPVLTLANPSTVVAGTLNSASNTMFALDFFANTACDATGNGEGQRYLGSANVSTNGGGDASFNINLSGASVVGEFITATATDPNGNTSEFSACRVVTAAAAPGPTDVAVTLAANPNPVAAGATLTYTMTVTNNGASNQATGVSATQTLPSGVTFLSADGATCALTGAVVDCSVGTLNPSASSPITIQVRADVGSVTLVSTAHVDTTTADPTPANNDASVASTVTGPGTRQVWVADAGAPSRISIINPDTNTAAGFINLAAPAYDVTFAPSGQRAYVANFTADNIAVIDTASNTIVNNVAVAAPVRVRVSPDGSRYYVLSGGSEVSVFNAQTDALITAIAVGGSPQAIAVSRDGRRLYVANSSDNTVSVIDANANSVIATIPVGDFPVGVAITPNGKRVFVSNYFGANVSVIDTTTNTVIASPDVVAGPQDIAIAPNGLTAYVANFDGNVVSVIDVSTNVVGPNIPVAGSPSGIVVSPNGDRVYVTGYNAAVVRVIDTATNAVTTSIAAGTFPIAVDYVRK